MTDLRGKKTRHGNLARMPDMRLTSASLFGMTRSICSFLISRHSAGTNAGRAEDGLRLLTGYLERYPSLDLLDTVFQQTMDMQGPQAAYAMVVNEEHCGCRVRCYAALLLRTVGIADVLSGLVDIRKHSDGILQPLAAGLRSWA